MTGWHMVLYGTLPKTGRNLHKHVKDSRLEIEDFRVKRKDK